MGFYTNPMAPLVASTTEETAGYTYVTPRQNLRGVFSPTSGWLSLYGFTPGLTRTITKLGVSLSATAAAGVTMFRMGLYTYAADGSITLVASTPNTTNSLNTAYNPYQVALTASYQLTAGTRYMVGCIIVASTMPTLNAAAGSDDYGNNSHLTGVKQRLCGYVTGQTDLPATVTNANIIDYGNAVHVLMVL